MHEAFAAALDTWSQAGVPDRPRPWLISTARFKAIDGMRRRARFDSAQKDLALYLEAGIKQAPHEDEEIEDDRLRLIFTCCHPALPSAGQLPGFKYGLGPIEIRAVADMNEMMKESEQRRGKNTAG
jgi:RNA polymerase sigma-70 factor, ECF subfamily